MRSLKKSQHWFNKFNFYLNGKPLNTGFPFFFYMSRLSSPFFFVAVLSLFLAGCKDEDQIGSGVQPGGRLGVITTDTITVKAVSLPGDSFPSLNLSNNYLGLISDQLYGKARYSLFSEFELSGATDSIPGSVPDSVVLYLKYRSYYGDLSQSQRIQVYEVTQGLPSASAYSDISEQPYIDTTKKLSDITFVPQPTATYVVLNDTIAALRVPLDNSILGTKFVNASSTDLQPTNWTSFFKGLFIKAVDQNLQSGKGAALNFNLDESKIVFYYSRSGNRHFAFPIPGKDGTHINQVNFDRSGSRLAANSGNVNPDTLFILGQGGQKVQITFPYITELNKLNPRGKITINKADLKLFQVVTGSGFTEASEIGAYELFNDGTAGSLQNSGTRISGAYTINIASYIQRAMNRNTNEGVIVKLKNDDNSPERLLLGGKNIKLVITFTKL